MRITAATAAFAILLAFTPASASQERPGRFVAVSKSGFIADRRPYSFIGTNYWYGSLLPLENNKQRGIERLRRELDFLKRHGITNLRLMAGAEGSGPLNGVVRVGPPLQPEQGRFESSALDGLDILLDEMRKRDMRAVIFFSNNWEWSGGFQQYLIWNNVIDRRWLADKPTWDELRDLTARFYSCEPCTEAYRYQVEYVLARRNTVNKRRYVDDPTIMAWQLANEPRPMRPHANEAYKRWIAQTAALIRARAPRQLIAIGHEGRIGTESLSIFEAIHADPNIDYLTIHIWPKNWGWFENGRMSEGFDGALSRTREYIDEHIAVARRLGKPLVIEEFGLPRDAQAFDPAAPTRLRDRYFEAVFGYIRDARVAGVNFWAFGGSARSVKGRQFWQLGDERMGDPPMEEQGLYSVFDSDISTWDVIRKAARRP